MAKLRLGVIGAGSWAVSSHLPNFARRSDEVEFVGVSRKGPLLGKIKDDWGFAVASEDYRDVIAAGMDICLVASPHGLHHEHAKAALEAGAHVLCEKPFTLDPAEAWDLVATAERSSRPINWLGRLDRDKPTSSSTTRRMIRSPSDCSIVCMPRPVFVCMTE